MMVIEMVRNYKHRMARYRLSHERYEALRQFCLMRSHRDVVREAMMEACDDALADWLLLHVTSKAWKWAKLEANGIPCCQDTFRLYRARFYWCLNQRLMRKEKHDESI